MTVVRTIISSGGKDTVKSVDKVEGKKITNISKDNSSSSSKSSSGGGSSKGTYTVTDSATGKEVGTYEYGGLKSRGKQETEQALESRAKAVLSGQGGQTISKSFEDVKGSIADRINRGETVTATVQAPATILGQGQTISAQQPTLATTYNPITGKPILMSTTDKGLGVTSTPRDQLAKQLMTGVMTGSSYKSTQTTSVPNFARPQSFEEKKQAEQQKAFDIIVGAGTEKGLTTTQASELASAYASRNKITDVLGSKLSVDVDSKIVPNIVERTTLVSGVPTTFDATKAPSVLTPFTPGLSLGTRKEVADTSMTSAKLTVDKSTEQVRAELSDFERAQAEMQSVNRAKAQFENAKTRQAELNAKIAAYESKSVLDRDPKERQSIQEEQRAIEQQFAMNPYVTVDATGKYAFSASYTEPKTPETQQFATSKFNAGEVTAYGLGRKLTTEGTLTPAEAKYLESQGTAGSIYAGVGRGLGAVESGARQVVPMFKPTEAGRTVVGSAVQRVTGIEDAETAKILGELGTKSVGYAALGPVASALGRSAGAATAAIRLGVGGTGTGFVGKSVKAGASLAEKVAMPAQVAYAGVGAYQSGKAALEGYQEGGAGRGLAAGLREAQKFVGADYLMTKGFTGFGAGYSAALGKRGSEVSQAKNLDIQTGESKGVQTSIVDNPNQAFQQQVIGQGTITAKAGDIFQTKVPYTYRSAVEGKQLTTEGLIGNQNVIRVLNKDGKIEFVSDTKGLFKDEYTGKGIAEIKTPGDKFTRDINFNIRTEPETGRGTMTSVFSQENKLGRDILVSQALKEGDTIYTGGKSAYYPKSQKPQQTGMFASSTTLKDPVIIPTTPAMQAVSFSSKEVGVTGSGGRAVEDIFAKKTVSPLSQSTGNVYSVGGGKEIVIDEVIVTPVSQAAPATLSDALKFSEESKGGLDILKRVAKEEPKTPITVIKGSQESSRGTIGGTSSGPASQPKQVQVSREVQKLKETTPTFAQTGTTQEVKTIIGTRGRVADFSKPYRMEGSFIKSALTKAQNLVKVPIMERSVRGDNMKLDNISQFQTSQTQTQQQGQVRVMDTALETKQLSDIGTINDQQTAQKTIEDQAITTKQTTDLTPAFPVFPAALAPIFGAGGGFKTGGFGSGFSGYSGERVNVGSSIKMNKLQELEFGKNVERFL